MELVLSVVDRALAGGSADQATVNGALSGLHLSTEHCGFRDDSHGDCLWAVTVLPQAECEDWPQMLQAANLAGCTTSPTTRTGERQGHQVPASANRSNAAC